MKLVEVGVIMTNKEQVATAKNFAEYWKDKGYEKENCSSNFRC